MVIGDAEAQFCIFLSLCLLAAVGEKSKQVCKRQVYFTCYGSILTIFRKPATPSNSTVLRGDVITMHQQSDYNLFG